MASTPTVQYATTADGVSIAYACFGRGPTLLFGSTAFGDVHMYGVAGYQTQLMTDALVERGWQVVRYDIRGMGNSDRQIADFSLEARLLDIEAVVDRVGVDRFSLAGWDVGAATAAAYAARHPERVSRLALINAWPLGRNRYEGVTHARALVSLQEMALQDWAFATLTFATLETTFSDTRLAREVASAFQSAVSGETWLACRKESERIDLTATLPRLPMPVLVVHEETFGFGSFDLCRQVATSVRDGRLVSADFDAEIAAIDAFLRDVPSSAPREAALPGPAPDGLSARELEVLRLVAAGRSNQQIAEELVLSLNTIKRHVSNIFVKTGSANRADATSYAHLRHLVNHPPG